MSNVIIWADIPVVDLQRAMKFYSHVTGLPVEAMPGSNDTVALIGREGGASGVVSADLYVGGTPSLVGCTVYLNTQGDIDGMAKRVVEAGGEILREKQYMGPVVGWVLFFKDSEGNRIGLEQMGDGPE